MSYHFLKYISILLICTDGDMPGPGSRYNDAIRLEYPHEGGVLITEAPGLGENITGGDVLGKVVSPYTFEELEIIKNPVKNGIMILSHLTWNLVNPGDIGYMGGDLDI